MQQLNDIQQQFQNPLTQHPSMGDPFAVADSSSQGSSSAATAGAFPASADGNRLRLMGVQPGAVMGGRPLTKKYRQDPTYDPFAVRQRTDQVSYGNVKANRIAQVRQNPEFANATDAQISKILSLGAPKHRGGFGPRGPTRAETQALENIATRHHIKFIPDLNARPTAENWLVKKRCDAADAGDQNALTKWQNYDIAEEDLDNDPSTANNIIIRNRANPDDVFAVNRMRIVNRTKSLVKRAIYEDYPTKEERTANKDFIDKIQKKYYQKYLTPADRARHPWNLEMAQHISEKMTATESAWSKFSRIVRAVLAQWGIKCKGDDGSTILTNKHWIYITQKFTSKIWRLDILPAILRNSAWAAQYPHGYDFVNDPDDLLNNKAFKDSIDTVYKRNNINGQGLLVDENAAGILIEMINRDPKISEDVELQPAGRNPIKIAVIDDIAEIENQRRIAKAQAGGRVGSRDDLIANHFIPAREVRTARRRGPRIIAGLQPRLPQVDNPQDTSFLDG